jgi:prophage regulatory protein
MPATLHTLQAAVPAPAATHSTAAAILNAPAVPADLADLQLLDIKAVSPLVGLKSSAIFERVRAKTFPAPIRLGQRCTRWTAKSIRAWLLEQIEGQQDGELQQRQQARATKASRAAHAKRQAGAQAAA